MAINAFADFYREHYPSSVRLAWLLTHDNSVIEDVVQDAFVRLHPRFDDALDRSAYLRTCVVNGCRDRARNARRSAARLRLVSATERRVASDHPSELLDAVASLSYNQRAAVVLRYWADLPEFEIAQILGVRPGIVHTVPAGTSVVGYLDGTGKTWWQRPIGRLAMFPRSRNDGTFTAYSEDGTELQTFPPETELDVSGVAQGTVTPGPTAMEDSLTPGQREDMRQIVRDQMRNCVEASGATYPNGPMFPVTADADPSTWDNCVDNVRTVVDQRFAALGGHLVPHLTPTETTDSTPLETSQPGTT